MRLFLAIELDVHFRQHLLQLQRTFHPLIPKAPLTKPDNLHLTLKFLGEVPDPAIAPLCDSLQPLRATSSISLIADQLVLFPDRGPIRIVGAGLTSPPPLLDLVSQIETACHTHGFPRETRPFRAHITLARPRMPLPPPLRPKLDDAANPAFPGPTMLIESITLMQSQLRPQGSLYTPVAHFVI